MFAQAIRAPAVAGLFYENDPHQLTTDVEAMLAAAPDKPIRAKALVVPHAGYIYSGPIAAIAYRTLKSRAKSIRRVILMGPTHRVAVDGMAVPSVAAFSSPLGPVPLDRDAIDHLLDLPQVVESDQAHAQEHALEVQLPFLQSVLKDFRLVPIAVGRANAREVAEVLERLWGGEETLILVSSDLSHYHAYGDARRMDGHTVEHILALQGPLDHGQACGATPLNGLIQVAVRKGMRTHLLDLRNSGDTAGDKDRVVGYAAIALTPGTEHAH